MKEIYCKLAKWMSNIGVDKYMHSDIGEWISIAVMLSTIKVLHWWAPLLAWIVGSVVGALKELVFDRKTGGHISFDDFLATSYGSSKPMVIAYVLLFLTSCGAQRIATSERDSVRVEIVERRVEIRDTVEIEIPKIIESAKVFQDTSYLSNDYARSEARICPDGGLFHSLETFEQRIRSPTKVNAIVRDSIIYRERLVTYTIKVPRELTAWQRFRLNWFWVLGVLVVAIFYCSTHN